MQKKENAKTLCRKWQSKQNYLINSLNALKWSKWFKAPIIKLVNLKRFGWRIVLATKHLEEWQAHQRNTRPNWCVCSSWAVYTVELVQAREGHRSRLHGSSFVWTRIQSLDATQARYKRGEEASLICGDLWLLSFASLNCFSAFDQKHFRWKSIRILQNVLNVSTKCFASNPKLSKRSERMSSILTQQVLDEPHFLRNQ